MTSGRGIRAGKAFIELFTDDRRMTRGLKKAQRRLKVFGASASKIGARIAGVGLAAGTGLIIPTKIFANFDDRIRVVRAVTGATEEQFASLREEAKRLGRTTSFTASQVADAMAELGRAGFDPTQILQATEGVLALSKATDTDLPRAAEIAGAALRGFNRPTAEMGRVVDVATATVNKSAQTLEDFFEAFKPVAPIAAETGEEIESTAAAIGILANNGIKGSLAGNALARAYKNLSNSATQKSLKGIGVEAVNASGDLRPLADIIADIGDATAGLGSAEKLSIFETLFGRGQAAALKLATSGDAFGALRDEIRNSGGIAVKTAEEMEAGIGGAFRRLMSAGEGVFIALGEAIADPLSAGADVLGRFAGWITTVINKNKELVVSALKIGAIVTGVGLAIASVGTVIIFAGAAIGGLAALIGGLITTAVIAAKVIAAIGIPVLIVTALMVGLGIAIFKYTSLGGAAIDWLKKQFETLRKAVGPVIEGIANAMKAGEVGLAAKILWLGVKIAWKAGINALSGLWEKAKAGFLTVVQGMFHGALAVSQQILHGLEVGWIETTAFLSKLWTNMRRTFVSLWEKTTTAVAKGIVHVEALFDDSVDVDARVQALNDELEYNLNEINRKADQDIARRESKRSRDRENASELNDLTLAEIGRSFKEAQAKINANSEQDKREGEAELAAAMVELNQAIAEARRIREETEGDGEPGTETGIPQIDALVKRLSDGVKAVGDKITVSGTFSARAAGGLAASADERTATATERAVELLQDIERKASRGMVFG